MSNVLHSALAEHLLCCSNIKSNVLESFDKLVGVCLNVIKSGGKIAFCGNGGSSSESSHIAAEFVCTFSERMRRPLPAIALTTDTSILSAVGNDFGFSTVFERQVMALLGSDDIIIGLSTSGNSENVVQALAQARKQDVWTASIIGENGRDGPVEFNSDICLILPSDNMPRIQEMSLFINHCLVEAIEEKLNA
jgi:D-sedoheptulose 7-phosphate isomerase